MIKCTLLDKLKYRIFFFRLLVYSFKKIIYIFVGLKDKNNLFLIIELK